MMLSCDISNSEIEIMRILWAESPLTSRSIIDRMMAISDWKEGTIKSFISRLIQKNIIHKDSHNKPYLLSPLISYQEATFQRIDYDLSPICRKDRGKLLAHLIDEQALSQADCQTLIDLLLAKKETAPAEVPCSCPPGQCQCHHSHL